MLQTNPQFYGNGNASISILDIHEAESVRTTLFCHVLPDAANACQRSRLADMRVPEKEDNISNTSTRTSNSAASTVRVPTTSATATDRRSNSQQSLWYDALVTAAAATVNDDSDSDSRLVDTAVWK
jgi:hypothetical protein